MHEYQYVWLIWSGAFLLPWTVLLITVPGHRSVMWRTSWATSLFGATEPIFVPEYWNPPSLFELAQRTGFDVESFIFCFAHAGRDAVAAVSGGAAGRPARATARFNGIRRGGGAECDPWRQLEIRPTEMGEDARRLLRERGAVATVGRYGSPITPARIDCRICKNWKGPKMLRRYQEGDVGTAMVVMMVAVMMIAFFSPWGMHGGGRDSHKSATPPAAEANRSALDLLDEQYVRGEISREEYLRKREDLTTPR